PLYIGVLLPLNGPEGQPLYNALMLSQNQINEGGGIGGRPVTLILRDTSTGDLMKYAEDLAKDPRIKVVIGPYSSDDLFAVADLFIKKQKVLISPSASSDEIYRAFSGSGSVWRTVSNDGDITSELLQHIKQNGGKNVALLTINSTYGNTFYDWIPYWAIEYNITITGEEKYSTPDEIPEAVNRLCTLRPDYLIFVHSGSGNEISSAIDMLEELNTSVIPYFIYPTVDKNGQILVRPDAEDQQKILESGLWNINNISVLSTIIPDKTLMLMSKEWDPDFSKEYKISKYGQSDYAPEVYDALLIASGVMARITAYPLKSPMNAALSILSNESGDLMPRTEEGFQSAFKQIQQGKTPVFTGATGPLTFKSEGTDRCVPWYGTYRMEDGKIVSDPVLQQNLIKSDNKSGLADNSTDVSSIQFQNITKGDFWAVIGAFSREWANYRHQADALTMYEYLKSQGVSDDHIILLVYDDIPTDKKNIRPGEVYHKPGEEEVRIRAIPDYIGETVDKKTLIDVLLEKAESDGRPLLQSDENSTVLVYLSSHGVQGGDLLLGNDSEITPVEFASIVDEMKEKKVFGRMLMVFESCFSGSIVDSIKTPGVIVMTASAANETSKAASYDSALSTWLSDEFTTELITRLNNSDSSVTLRQLFHQIYYHVRSSHPTISMQNASLDIPAELFFGGA
ncbi:MAG TPA: C13 family peptidase, partial [Methanospirillum sp.]|uniref:C13 family peptidase n=1 Tax=Methanospirillum sp. TaxID=45200 RepID=UPI002BA192DE